MTISLTVILIESTNEISYGLPLMIVLMVGMIIQPCLKLGIEILSSWFAKTKAKISLRICAD